MRPARRNVESAFKNSRLALIAALRTVCARVQTRCCRWWDKSDSIASRSARFKEPITARFLSWRFLLMKNKQARR